MRLAIVTLTAIIAVASPANADSNRRLRLAGPAGEVITVRPFAARGRLHRPAWRRINRLLAARQGDQRTMHPRLVATLVQIQRHFGGALIRVSSAYRTGDRWQRESYHQVGRAVDLRVEGVSNRVVFDYCQTLPRLGCGLYLRGSHVHVDVRGRAAVWVDTSAAAAPPRYLRNARHWLRRHPEAGR